MQVRAGALAPALSFSGRLVPKMVPSTADLVAEFVPYNPKVSVSVSERDFFVLSRAVSSRRVSFSARGDD
jgi:hypothetical protein